MQLSLQLCGTILLCLGVASGASKSVACTGSGGVTCGGKQQLGYAELKAGTQIASSRCSAAHSACNVSQLNGHDAKCVTASAGYNDPPYNKVMLFIGLYTAEGDYLFCRGDYASGWGTNGCSC